MALDSANKRFSAVHHGSPWRGLGYFPTGTVDAGERLGLLFLYSGIATSPPVTVPDVVGQAQAAGTATLTGDGFVVAVVTAYSSTVPAGTIISQSPVGGSSAASGSAVTITVSLGDAPVTDQPTGGFGWWPDYEHVRRQREKRKREIEEAEEQAQLVKDELDRQIYLAQRKAEAEEADRADLKRLQALADQYAGKVADLPKPVSVAILNAQDARTRNALEQMRRQVEQFMEFEEQAIAQVVLLLLTD